MLYLKGDKAYRVDGDGKVHGVDITAKDKVITRRELESVSVVDAATVAKLPAGAVPVTIDTIIAKFNVSEENPLTYRKASAKAAKAE